jgi:hypothetical protein
LLNFSKLCWMMTAGFQESFVSPTVAGSRHAFLPMASTPRRYSTAGSGIARVPITPGLASPVAGSAFAGIRSRISRDFDWFSTAI